MSARSAALFAAPLRARVAPTACRCISRPTPSGPSTPTAPRLARTLLTRRTTSFWATSYPMADDEHRGSLATMPPLPAPSAVVEPPAAPESRSRRRERYLDSLMDKAGHMYLKCTWLQLMVADDRLDP